MILVFGSLNVDLIFRLPVLPRAGQTVLAPTYARAHGGKGANQAVAAARAGASVRMVGRVGRDEMGDSLLESLAAESIDQSAIQGAATPTGLAIIALDAAGENQILVASGANLEARASDVPVAWLGSGTVILQLEVPYDACFAVGRAARRAGSRVVLNAAPAGPVDPEAFDILIVNEDEATAVAKAAGVAGRGTTAARALAATLRRTVVATLGARGAVAYDGGRTVTVGALPVTPVDTTGAGDAFVGAFAAAMDDGGSLEDALRHGVVAGALACLVEGAQPSMPRADAIAARISECPAPRVRRMAR
jgi:ribokinase